MANIIIKDAGPNKRAIRNRYSLIAHLGLKEAQEAIDGLEEGKEIVIPMEGADQAHIDEMIKWFTDDGAYAYEDTYKSKSSFAQAMKASENKSFSAQGSDSNSTNESFEKDSVNVGTLGRDETMAKLIETGKVAKELEELSISKSRIVTQINQHKMEVTKIREYVPAKGSLWIGPGLLIAFLGWTIIGLVVALIWHSSMNKKYKQTYLAEHEAENNQNAEAYIAENIVPLENQLEDVNNKVADLYESGKVEEAIDFVGEDLFNYGCIEDLYNIIKSRKADNLKEALNLYDDTLHKARMEEMQAAIQNASEVAAAETVKQTAYSKEIAKSSHQAATAAKATAYNTRQIDKNTRRFR